MADTAEQAKAYLLKQSSGGLSVWEHMTNLMLKLLEERPDNALELFENLSREVRAATLPTKSTLPLPEFREVPQKPSKEEQELVQRRLNLFKDANGDLSDEDEDTKRGRRSNRSHQSATMPNEGEMPNIVEEMAFFEWAGISLGREEVYRIMLSMKRLLEQNPLKSVRLFGKFLGTSCDYIVVESEFKEGEGENFEEELPSQKGGKKHRSVVQTGGGTSSSGADSTTSGVEDSEDDEESEDEEDRAAKKADEDAQQAAAEKQAEQQKYKLPAEKRSGANRYTYWVATEPSGPWRRLPDVLPEHIVAARQIVRFFTGNLDSEVVSYPPFPGKEMHLLRAQIARIAASTVVSPKGYFRLEDEGEGGQGGGSGAGEGDAEGEDPLLEVDAEFAGLSNDELLSLENWVHHYRYLLPQGRCSYFRPPKPPRPSHGEGAAGEEEEEPEEEEEVDEESAEEGPKLLTELAEDEGIGESVPAWTARLSSQLTPKTAFVLLRNNRWPGAVAFGQQDRFANIYVGYGVKYGPYTPPLPPPPQIESDDVVEVADPTVQEEREVERLRKEREQPAAEDREDDGGEGTEEEEEEDMEDA